MTEVFIASYEWGEDEYADIGCYSTYEKANEVLQLRINYFTHNFDGTSYIPYGAHFKIVKHVIDSEQSECVLWTDFFRDEELIKVNNLRYWRSKNGQD